MKRFNISVTGTPWEDISENRREANFVNDMNIEEGVPGGTSGKELPSNARAT